MKTVTAGHVQRGAQDIGPINGDGDVLGTVRDTRRPFSFSNQVARVKKEINGAEYLMAHPEIDKVSWGSRD